MGSEHTPGPWKWNGFGARQWLEAGGVYVIKGVDEECPYLDLRITDEDAALIEAAPELLALLRELRDDAVCFPAPKQSGHTTGTSRRANVSWDLVVRAGALLERIERKEAGDARDRD